MSAPVIPAPTGARLVEVALPLVAAYRSGTSHLTERRVLLVAVAAGGIAGWGECSPVPGYSPESLDECRTWLASRLSALVAGAPPPPARGPATAQFALETAIADLEARLSGEPLWRQIGGSGHPVPVGAVIGLEPETGRLPADAADLAAAGYRRIKLKVDGDRTLERVAAVRRALPDHDLAVDANGTFDPADPDAVARLDRFGLSFVEQPFPAGDLDAHRRLSRIMETPVCLDESIDGTAAAARAIDAGAASIVNIKPARLGGLRAAVAVHDLARSAGWSAWCGGMLESGIGKAAALAAATLPGMTLPADLPPSARHFESDLIDPGWEMEGGMLRLPSGPGLGVEPHPDLLKRAGAASTAFGDDVGLPV